MKKKTSSPSMFISQSEIEQRIFLIRGYKVMIDRDLAELYGVETKYLNRQVKRNKDRFSDEFTFNLNSRERDELVTKCHRFESMKHSTVLPYAFTEYGVVMLASILNSEQAVKMSIHIVKTFVQLRKMMIINRDLSEKLIQLERMVGKHDQAIIGIFEAIRNLMGSQNNDDYKRNKAGFLSK